MTTPPPINQHTLDLINADIDGELRASEREALTELLTHSPQAKELHVRLTQISLALDDLPSVELGVSLSTTVLHKVSSKAQTQSSDKSPSKSNWLATLLTGQWQAGAAAVAIAAIVAVSISQFSAPIDPQAGRVMVGTLLPQSKLASWKQLDRAIIDNPLLHASLDLTSNSDALQLNVMLDGGTAQHVTLQIQSDDFAIRSLQTDPPNIQTNSPISGQSQIKFDDIQASVVNQQNQRYQLKLEHKSQSKVGKTDGFQLRVYADKQLILNKSFDVTDTH
jgi:hypothetical protein